MRLYQLAYDFFEDPVDWAFAALFAMLTLAAWGLRFWEPSLGGPFTTLSLNFAAFVVILLALQYLWRAAFPNYPFTAGPAWRRFIAYPLRQFVYAAAGVLLVSGAFEAIFSGASFDVLGISAGSPALADRSFASVARATNQIAAFLLPAGLVAYLGLIVLAAPARHTTSTALVATAAPANSAPLSPQSALIGQDLARRIRLTGWIGFWLDFVLVFLTAPLLAFGAVGQSISSTIWVSDPIQWGYLGLGLLLASLFLDFFWTIASGRLVSDPARMLAADQSAALWFLGLGSLVNIVGAVVSFIGVGLSIALLVAKTVSQPPGIAITDPDRIVRALDVFILMANFNLLLAHFIGAGAAVWLSMEALKARHKFAISMG
jgi:cytochrome b561